MNHHLRQCQVPVLNRVSPLFRSAQDTGIEQFQKAVLIREPTFGFGQFTELTVHRFNSVGGVDGFTDILRVLEVHRQIVPAVAPGAYDDGVLFAPLGVQVVQRDLCGAFGGGPIDSLQIVHERFLVFGADVLHGVADLVNDALLHLGVWINGFNGLREAGQAIDTGNQDVFDAAVLQVGEHAEPVVSAFGVRQVQPDQLLFAFDVQGQNGINRFADVAAILAYFIVNGIEPDDRINRVQIALPPALQLRQQLVGDRIECTV